MSATQLSIEQAASTLRPVEAGERILALDVLRGFALFGVLLAYALWNLGTPPEDTYSSFDRILNRGLTVLVDTKAYTLFAILFGVGFSIQLTRASSRGARIVPVYCRRLLALLLIGLTDALLLRNGDILVPYATMGFILLLFRNASNRTLAIGAIVGLLFPYVARSAWELTGVPFPQRPETEGVGYFASNIAWVRYWYTIAITSWPASLPMFLFGLYIGRSRFIDKIGAHRRWLWIALVAGLAIGVSAPVGVESIDRIWNGVPQPFAPRVISGLLRSLHAWGLAAFYASSILFLLQTPARQRRLAPLAAVGRMALTNYLLQSVILIPVCMALNLFDRVTPAIGTLLALGVWTFQVPASIWWLKRFRFGPAEWLWRSLTYGHPQPMRAVQNQTPAPTS